MSTRIGWSTPEFASLIGVNQNTVFRWHNRGTLLAATYPSGRRYYTVEHLWVALGRSAPPEPLDADYQAFVIAQLGPVMARGIDARVALEAIDRDWRSRQVVGTPPSVPNEAPPDP
jgi:hypothetical protein